MSANIANQMAFIRLRWSLEEHQYDQIQQVLTNFGEVLADLQANYIPTPVRVEVVNPAGHREVHSLPIE